MLLVLFLLLLLLLKAMLMALVEALLLSAFSRWMENGGGGERLHMKER
jgi:hypothetical protein